MVTATVLPRRTEASVRPSASPGALAEPSGNAASRAPVKVIYIAGYGRSGTTLLDIALGERPGVMGAGEVATLARHVWENDEYCACGTSVRTCPLWADIIADWRHGEHEAMLAEYRRGQQRTESIVAPGRWVERLGGRDHARRTAKLLRAIAARSGRPIIVDSSKLPGRGFALAALRGVDLHVVHVVRDGRAVAWSMMKPHARQIERGVQRELRPKPLLYTALRWTVVNLATELLCRQVGSARSLRIRYEDFVADPDAALDRIVALVGEPGASTASNRGARTLSPQHQVAGSRHRMLPTITIRRDDGWRSEMPPLLQRIFSAAFAPVLLHYGYRLGVSRGGGEGL